MAPTTGQGDQPLNDLEDARDSHSGAPNPQTESGIDSNSTRFQADQRTEIEKVEKVIVLSFRSLQLQRIAELQDELLRLAIISAAGKATPDQTENVDKALENYAKALRNYETLSLNGLSKVPRGATLVGSILSTGKAGPSRYTLGRLLNRLVNRLVNHTKHASRLMPFLPLLETLQAVATADIELTSSKMMEVIQGVVGNLGYRELDPLGREKRSQKTALTERIIMAMFGGVALIAPMLIMTLHPSRNVSLVTTSLATFIFALILAVAATGSAGKDVLAATAAYTAVLVVFVGTNTTGSSQ